MKTFHCRVAGCDFTAPQPVHIAKHRREAHTGKKLGRPHKTESVFEQLTSLGEKVSDQINQLGSEITDLQVSLDQKRIQLNELFTLRQNLKQLLSTDRGSTTVPSAQFTVGQTA